MVHEAGPLDETGVQRCVRCDFVLTDYRGAMVPEGSGPLYGWAEGASIEVLLGNPRYSGTTDQEPDCERTQ
jgi:hypothetical protein